MAVIGTFAGVLLITLLASQRSRAWPVAWFAVSLPVPLFLVGIKLVELFTGRQRVVHYEQFLWVLVALGVVLNFAGQPVWIGLDLATLGIALTLAFGRIGCLRVGCCHGRPARVGIAYSKAHGRAGFTRYYVSVRLFPIQLVSAIVLFGLVTVASMLFLRSRQPGEVVCFYFACYAGARFVIEFFRGDPDRGFALGASEAQWTALVTSWAVVLIATQLHLAVTALYWSVAGVLTSSIVVLAVVSRRLMDQPWAVRHPHRVRELAAALDELGHVPGAVSTAETSDGIRLSFSKTEAGGHYGISSARGPMTQKIAEAIAQQIMVLNRAHGVAEVVQGKQPGVFHVLVSSQSAS